MKEGDEVCVFITQDEIVINCKKADLKAKFELLNELMK